MEEEKEKEEEGETCGNLEDIWKRKREELERSREEEEIFRKSKKIERS